MIVSCLVPGGEQLGELGELGLPPKHGELRCLHRPGLSGDSRGGNQPSTRLGKRAAMCLVRTGSQSGDTQTGHLILVIACSPQPVALAREEQSNARARAGGEAAHLPPILFADQPRPDVGLEGPGYCQPCAAMQGQADDHERHDVDVVEDEQDRVGIVSRLVDRGRHRCPRYPGGGGVESVAQDQEEFDEAVVDGVHEDRNREAGCWPPDATPPGPTLGGGPDSCPERGGEERMMQSGRAEEIPSPEIYVGTHLDPLVGRVVDEVEEILGEGEADADGGSANHARDCPIEAPSPDVADKRL